MTLISDLYNKVLNFFNAENKEDENSKDTACNRLKLVLMQDRTKLEPVIMEKLRQEMIEVISKYIEIDTEALGLNLAAEGESFALMLNIPVIRAKSKEEIEAAEKIKLGAKEDDVDDDDEDEDDEAAETFEDEKDEEITDEEENSEVDDASEKVEEKSETNEATSDDTEKKEDEASKDKADEITQEPEKKEEKVLKDVKPKTSSPTVKSIHKKKENPQKKDDE